DTAAYKAALAVTVVAAVLQILFGVFRAGILGEFFPVSAVHGMLAAIGVIIIAKQIPTALGVTASGEPIELLKRIPEFVQQANPAIASIGLVSILIVFLWPIVKKNIPFGNAIPSPLVVLLIAIPMEMYFDLLNPHQYSMF
ncbi:MAG: SulP family inorganic anion transporter, partial [bacterium]